MPKRNVMQALNITPDGSMPKNPYDLHSYEYLHHKLGQFVPIAFRETVPDANYRVAIDSYMFSLPCNTASLADMKENYYFIWVPYSQIVNNVYSFFVQRKDLQSALDYSHEQVPVFSLGDVVYRCVFMSLAPPATEQYRDIHGFNIYEGALRLLDLCGYGCFLDFLALGRKEFSAGRSTQFLAGFQTYCHDVLNQYMPNVLRLAAYQKAWYCYFRNMQYDTEISPRCFNFDDVVYHQTGVTPDFNVLHHRSLDNFIKECCQLRYVGYKKDIFTGCMPGTQYGAVSSVTLKSGLTMTGVTSNDVNRWNASGGDDNWIQARNIISNSSVAKNLSFEGAASVNHTHAVGTIHAQGGQSLFDVLQLVESQAIQKWKQKSMLAGQKAQNQYRAHYGVVPRHLEDHYPDFIGSVDNLVHIDKIVNNANTVASEDMTNLGDLGGRGYAASVNKVFNFHSSEHGVLVVLKAIVPENLYSSYGLDRANQLVYYSDFWQPEFQNIGLEAVPKTLLDVTAEGNSSMSGDSQDSTQFNASDVLIGYAPRNYQLKQYPSRVHGMFNPSRLTSWIENDYVPFGFSDIQSFVMPRLDLVSSIIYNTENGHFSHGTSPLDSDVNLIPYTLDKFYVSPSLANSVFVVDADNHEDTDPFFCKSRVVCDAVQPLTPIGLPQF